VVLAAVGACSKKIIADKPQGAAQPVNSPVPPTSPVPHVSMPPPQTNANDEKCDSSQFNCTPIEPALIRKCVQLGIGAECHQTFWTNVTYTQVQFEVEVEIWKSNEQINIDGDFSPQLVALCKQYGGGYACDTKRWNRLFYVSLIDLMQSPQKVPDSDGYWINESSAQCRIYMQKLKGKIRLIDVCEVEPGQSVAQIFGVLHAPGRKITQPVTCGDTHRISFQSQIITSSLSQSKVSLKRDGFNYEFQRIEASEFIQKISTLQISNCIQ